MPDIEKSALLKKNDGAGNTYVVHPYTKAENVDYDNTNSGLTADNVKAAIDELSDCMPPAVSEAHKQLVTDSEGNAKWEDRLAYEETEETQLARFDFEGAGWAYATDLGGWYVDMPETITELPIIGETYIIKCVHKPTGAERFYNAQCKGTPSGVYLGDLNSDTPFQISISKSDGSVTVANVGLFLIDDSRTNYYLYILHRNTNVKKLEEKFMPTGTAYQQCVQITLTVSGWDRATQTQAVTVSGVTATETDALIVPTPAMASMTAYMDAEIHCSAQAANSLTFTCETVPTSDLTVYVTIIQTKA